MNRVEIAGPAHSRMGQPERMRQTMTAVVMCLSIAACSGEQDRITGSRPPNMEIAQFETGDLTDPQIDPADSYLITRSVTRTTTTVESAEPFVDPMTGQQVTTLTFPDVIDSTRFEAGYDAVGSVRMNEVMAGTDSGSRAARVVIANNAATFYDGMGAVVYDTSGPILMDAIGSTDNLVVTSEAILREEDLTLEDSGSVLLTGAAMDPNTRAARIERKGDRLFRYYSLDDPESGLRGTRVRQYRRAGAEWVVTEERVETTQASAGMALRVVETTRYPLVKWKTNREKDDRRRKLRAQAVPASLAGAGSAWRAAVGSESLWSRAGQGNTISAALEDTTTCLICADDGEADTVDSKFFIGTKLPINLAYQHGAFSDSTVWLRTDYSMRMRYNVVHRVLPTLDSRQSLEAQAVQLNNRMIASGGQNFLVIGHSNGGLVARRAGQFASYTTGPVVAGVVAIASPHQGVPLAFNARHVVSGVLSAQVKAVITNIGGNCGVRQFAWLCTGLSDVAMTFIPRIVNHAFDAAIPMSAEVRPGSEFTRVLNSTPEPFLKYSIEVQSQGAWKFVRMLGDWRCDPDQRCSGNHLQNMMESAYEVLRRCGSNEISKILAPRLATRCRSVRWSLNTLNTFYERFTAPGDHSDGLVPARSQGYPGADFGDRFVLRNAKESHAGELKSVTVRDRLFTATERFLAYVL